MPAPERTGLTPEILSDHVVRLPAAFRDQRILVTDALVLLGLASSKSEARRLVCSGAVYAGRADAHPDDQRKARPPCRPERTN